MSDEQNGPVEDGGWVNPGATNPPPRTTPAPPPMATPAPPPMATPAPPAMPVQPAMPAQPTAPTVERMVELTQLPDFPMSPDEVLASRNPSPRKPLRQRRALWITTAAVVVAGLVAGGIYLALPGRTGNSVVAAVKCRPTLDLTSCLIKEPQGALQLTDFPVWDKGTIVTTDAYTKYIAGDVPSLSTDSATQLQNDQVQMIAHTDWNAVDGDDVDLVALYFRTQKGAQDWNDWRTGGILDTYRGQAVSIPGDTKAKAYFAAGPNALSQYQAAYSEVVGSLVLNVAYTSPNQARPQDLQNWAGTELASLRSAPAPSADPDPIPTGNEQVTCTSGIDACLMPMPDGGTPWSFANDNTSWPSSTDMSVKQFVTDLWDGRTSAEQAQVISDLTQNGTGSIAHVDWGTNGFNDQGDVYLLQTLTQQGAATLYSDNFGEPDWSDGLHGTSYTIPGEPAAQAWYTTAADKDGLVDFAFVANFGNVIVNGFLFFSGSFDSHLADEWATAQLDRVGRGLQTVQMGVFPLTAPTGLPAAGQGTCGTPSACLMQLPARAVDTTATGSTYDSSGTVDAQQYSTQWGAPLDFGTQAWMTADGFSTGQRRSWTLEGATADVAVLKYGSPAQAEAAALVDYGSNAQAGIVCTDAAVADALCLEQQPETSDPLQNVSIRIVGWQGPYEVSVDVKTSNRADLADAYLWLRQQMNRLPSA